MTQTFTMPALPLTDQLALLEDRGLIVDDRHAALRGAWAHRMAIAPDSMWRTRLDALLAAYPTGDLAAMGFPADWRARALWR